MNAEDQAEHEAVQALEFAVKHPETEGGVNLRDAVQAIARYVEVRRSVRNKHVTRPAPTEGES